MQATSVQLARVPVGEQVALEKALPLGRTRTKARKTVLDMHASSMGESRVEMMDHQ